MTTKLSTTFSEQLVCGCTGTCRKACRIPNALKIHERHWFEDQVQRIKGFENTNVTHCIECSWCNKNYPIAFFVFPTDKDDRYEPYCIPCLYKYANPTQQQYEDNIEIGGRTYTDKLYANFHSIIRDIVRHPDMPLARIMLGWHNPLRSRVFLSDPVYFFQFNVE